MNAMPEIAESFSLSQETTKLQAKLNAAIDQWNASLAQYESQVRRLAEADGADLDQLGQLPAMLKSEKQTLAMRELRIRRSMREYFRLRDQDRQAAVEAAHARYEAAKSTLREKLLGIGYVDGPLPDGGACIVALFFMRHPKTYAARLDYDALSEITTSPHEPANESRLRAIEAELAEVRRELVAAAR